MMRLVLLICCLLLLPVYTFAQKEALNIAVALFHPPHVMVTGNSQVFGFDISMMRTICEELNVKCNFKPMPFPKIIPAVMNNEVDAGIGAITITLARAEEVDFSSPYLPSYAHIMTSTNTISKHDKTLDFKKLQFGALEGTVYLQTLKDMNIPDEHITIYNTESELLSALNEADIDIIILDNPTAQFWDTRVPNFVEYGSAFIVGNGLGIAINKNNKKLLDDINQAMDVYLQSPKFKTHYSTFISPLFEE